MFRAATQAKIVMSFKRSLHNLDLNIFISDVIVNNKIYDKREILMLILLQ